MELFTHGDVLLRVRQLGRSAQESGLRTGAIYAQTGRDTTNATDGMYQQGDDESTLSITPTGKGYQASLPLVLRS